MNSGKVFLLADAVNRPWRKRLDRAPDSKSAGDAPTDRVRGRTPMLRLAERDRATGAVGRRGEYRAFDLAIAMATAILFGRHEVRERRIRAGRQR
jgi:hypothetical protein